MMIRRARPDDIPAIIELIRDLAEYEKARENAVATEEDLNGALFGNAPAVFAHVAEHEGNIVGFALWFLNYSTWTGRHGIYLEDLYVDPRVRGHGLGKALLATLASLCVERGYTRLEWWVLDWNRSAIGFYESVGAVPMSQWTVHRLTGDALTKLGAARGR